MIKQLQAEQTPGDFSSSRAGWKPAPLVPAR
jgi:hypothetical protein